MTLSRYVHRADPELLRAVGEGLRHARRARGLTMAAAAERAGLARRTVHRAERGDNPTLLTLLRLLRLYDRLDALAPLVEPEVSPIELVAREGRRSRG